MDHQAYEDESRFAKYVESLAGVIGHADRVVPLRHYCVGLLAAEGRKSVEPRAAVTAASANTPNGRSQRRGMGNPPGKASRCFRLVGVGRLRGRVSGGGEPRRDYSLLC